MLYKLNIRSTNFVSGLHGSQVSIVCNFHFHAHEELAKLLVLFAALSPAAGVFGIVVEHFESFEVKNRARTLGAIKKLLRPDPIFPLAFHPRRMSVQFAGRRPQEVLDSMFK